MENNNEKEILSGAKFLDAACSKLEGLDIYRDPVGRSLFLNLAVNYVRAKLKKDGIDIKREGTYEDFAKYCDAWLKEFPNCSNENAFIFFTTSLSSVMQEYVARRTIS